MTFFEDFRRLTGLREGRSLKVGDKIPLPTGTSIGMGKLKKDVIATVDTIETDNEGKTFYRVSWVEKGKSRNTYYRPK